GGARRENGQPRSIRGLVRGPGWRRVAVCCGEDELGRLWRATFLRRVDDLRGRDANHFDGRGVEQRSDATADSECEADECRESLLYRTHRVPVTKARSIPSAASVVPWRRSGSDASAMLQRRHGWSRGATRAVQRPRRAGAGGGPAGVGRGEPPV